MIHKYETYTQENVLRLLTAIVEAGACLVSVATVVHDVTSMKSYVVSYEASEEVGFEELC